KASKSALPLALAHSAWENHPVGWSERPARVMAWLWVGTARFEHSATRVDDQRGPAMDCCGVAHHEITVQAGSSTLTLMRCSHCSQQAWTLDGQSVEREEAF